MLLKPLDVVVAVKAAVREEPHWTIAQLANELGMDKAQVFRAARQAATSRLLLADRSGPNPVYAPHRAALLELLIHGVKYMAIPARGRIVRGVPTAHAAPILAKELARRDDDVIPVWPTPDGSVRGESFEPLHRCVPGAAALDPRFYDAMALVDAIRDGRARERNIAAKKLKEVIGARRK